MSTIGWIKFRYITALYRALQGMFLIGSADQIGTKNGILESMGCIARLKWITVNRNHKSCSLPCGRSKRSKNGNWNNHDIIWWTIHIVCGKCHKLMPSLCVYFNLSAVYGIGSNRLVANVLIIKSSVKIYIKRDNNCFIGNAESIFDYYHPPLPMNFSTIEVISRNLDRIDSVNFLLLTSLESIKLCFNFCCEVLQKRQALMDDKPN